MQTYKNLNMRLAVFMMIFAGVALTTLSVIISIGSGRL
jgi:hypothetical protein